MNIHISMLKLKNILTFIFVAFVLMIDEATHTLHQMTPHSHMDKMFAQHLEVKNLLHCSLNSWYRLHLFILQHVCSYHNLGIFCYCLICHTRLQTEWWIDLASFVEVRCLRKKTKFKDLFITSYTKSAYNKLKYIKTFLQYKITWIYKNTNYNNIQYILI